MNIPDEAVEAAARKLFQSTMDEPWEAAYPAQEEHFRDRARVILEAAAPHIAAQAKANSLEEVADHLGKSGKLWWGDSGATVMEEGRPTKYTKLTDWIRARADIYRSQA